MSKPVKKTAPSPTQRLVMNFIRSRGAPDLDEILDHINAASKASLQFTIRALVHKGLIVKLGTQLRRGRQRQTFGLSAGGLAFYDPRASVAHHEKSVSDFDGVPIPGVEVVSDPWDSFVAHHEKSVSDFHEPEVFLE